jgi:hypothetical protein
MPLTPWIEVLGYRCVYCGAYATHWYGHVTVCCQCHGGQTASEHCLRLWGVKPTVLDQRNLLDLHILALTH